MKMVQTGTRYVKRTNQTKQKSKLEFMGKCLYTQREACVCRISLCMHAYDMHARDCSKTLTQKHETKKQSRNKNPNSNNQTCSKHKKNYKTNLNKHA